jgi:hypothetical protein
MFPRCRVDALSYLFRIGNEAFELISRCFVIIAVLIRRRSSGTCNTMVHAKNLVTTTLGKQRGMDHTVVLAGTRVQLNILYARISSHYGHSCEK